MLNLGHTRTVTDVGLAHLARLKKLEVLIIMRAPEITSRGVAHLTALPLKRLTIQNSRIGDAGIASIAFLPCGAAPESGDWMSQMRRNAARFETILAAVRAD